MRLSPSCIPLLLAPCVASAVDDVKVHFLDTDKPGAYAFTVTGTVDAPPLAVRHVVLHACAFKDRYAYIDACVVWQVEGARAWQYQLMDLPVLSPRDYGIVRHVVHDLAPDGSGVLRVDFSIDPVLGPAPRSGTVRVRVNEGYYEARGADDGRRTRLSYQTTIAPGGYVPVWVAKLAARRATPELFGQIEIAARELAASGKSEVPVQGTPWHSVRVGPLGLPLATRPAAR